MLLAGDLPEFPLSLGAPRVDAFAAAIAKCDPHLAVTAALPLLGLGPGLTPSGDDLVGAAFFGKRLVLVRGFRRFNVGCGRASVGSGGETMQQCHKCRALRRPYRGSKLRSAA